MRTLKLWLALILFNAVLIYVIAFIGNIFVAQSMMLLPNPESMTIEMQRMAEEDEPWRKQALAEGLFPTIYPILFKDTAELRELGERTGYPLLGGLQNKESYYCNEGYGLIRTKTDRFGYNNPDDIWNDVRGAAVVMIGDSYVRGACVRDDDTMPAIIRAAGHKTFNLGSGGNAPIHYAAVAKTFIPRIKPKHAVLVFYANDNKTAKTPEALQEDFYYRRYIAGDAADHYVAAVGSALIPAKIVQDVADEAARITLLRVNDMSSIDETMARAEERKASKNRPLFLNPKYWELWHTKQIIRGAFKKASLDEASKLAIQTVQEECAKAGCKVLVGFIPPSAYWRPDNRAAAYAGMLKEFSQEQGAAFIDLTEALKPMGRDAYALKGPHLSPAGYKRAAETIRQNLQP